MQTIVEKKDPPLTCGQFAHTIWVVQCNGFSGPAPLPDTTTRTILWHGNTLHK